VEESITFIIKKNYSKLRKSEQKVAEYLLSNDGDIEQMSISQLARNAEVSQPTVMRFAKGIGLENYKELKLALTKERVHKSMEKDKKPSLYGFPISSEDKMEDIPAKVITKTTQLLNESLKSIDVGQLELAVKAIVRARTVAVYGVENSSTTVEDLTTKLLYLGINCKQYGDFYLQNISANALGKEDVAVGVSYTGYSKNTVDVMKQAKKAGATTIIITNYDQTLLSKYADITICLSNEQFLYGNAIFSRSTQLAVVDMIFMGILLSDYETYTKRLDENSQLITSQAYHR
jgi:DNA-binding MurR/RpiR family transcriptional regulator